MNTELTQEQLADIALAEDLNRRGRSTYSTRVVDLFQRIAGDRFQEVGTKAIEIMADEGKNLERALADALELLKVQDAREQAARTAN